MKKKKIIFILGMHRSGTSAFSGILKHLGADLGKSLIKPSFDNTKGFFENEGIFRVHEDILRQLGTSWDNLSPLPEKWWKKETANAFRKSLKQVFSEEFSGDIIAIKDPRLSILFPLWMEIARETGFEYCCVIPFRNPLEVARSIEERNSIPIDKSVLLWAYYNLSAELLSRGCPRIFLSFDTLLKDPRSVIKSLISILKLKLQGSVDKLFSENKDFLEPGLKHHSYNAEENKSESIFIRSSIELYDILSNLDLKNNIGARDLVKINSARENFKQLFGQFSNIESSFWYKMGRLTALLSKFKMREAARLISGSVAYRLSLLRNSKARK